MGRITRIFVVLVAAIGLAACAKDSGPALADWFVGDYDVEYSIDWGDIQTTAASNTPADGVVRLSKSCVDKVDMMFAEGSYSDLYGYNALFELRKAKLIGTSEGVSVRFDGEGEYRVSDDEYRSTSIVITGEIVSRNSLAGSTSLSDRECVLKLNVRITEPVSSSFVKVGIESR